MLVHRTEPISPDNSVHTGKSEVSEASETVPDSAIVVEPEIVIEEQPVVEAAPPAIEEEEEEEDDDDDFDFEMPGKELRRSGHGGGVLVGILYD